MMTEDGRGVGNHNLKTQNMPSQRSERFECASSLSAWHYPVEERRYGAAARHDGRRDDDAAGILWRSGVNFTVPPPAMMDAAMMTLPVSVTIRRDCGSSSQRLAG